MSIFVPSVIRIDIPALDRLVDFFTGEQQAEIDALTARLAKTNEALRGAIQKEKT